MTSVAMRWRSSRCPGWGTAAGETAVGPSAAESLPGPAAPRPSTLSMGRRRGSPARKMIRAKIMPAAAIQNERL